MSAQEPKRRLFEVSTKHPDDVELCAAASGGDPRARRLLLQTLMDRVRATVRYISVDDRDREDWVQLALMEILKCAGTYQGTGSLGGWADKITVRTALRHLKRRRRREDRVAVEPAESSYDVRESSDEHVRLMMRRRVARILAVLPLQRRVALILHLVHGYTVQEVADIMGTRLNTAKDRIQKGRKAFKEKTVRDPLLRGWVESRLE